MYVSIKQKKNTYTVSYHMCFHLFLYHDSNLHLFDVYYTGASTYTPQMSWLVCILNACVCVWVSVLYNIII